MEGGMNRHKIHLQERVNCYEATEISQRYVFCLAFHPVSGLCYGLVARLSPVDLRNFIHPCAVRRSAGLFLLPVRQRDRMDHERAACAADKAHAKRIPRGVAGMHDRVLCAGCSERHEAGAVSGFDLAVSCVFVLWTGRDRLCTGYVRNLGLRGATPDYRILVVYHGFDVGALHV